MYYVHNLGTDKLNIFTGRENWKALPDATRDLIKRNCLFSRTQSCWISKAKGGRVWWLDQLTTAGFENRGTSGERLSFEEQIVAKQERAEVRAERCEELADKNAAAAQSLIDHARTMADAIPFGQPILVGHYSERRDRNYRDRIQNTFSRGFETLKKSEYYEGRAETAKQTAEGAELSNPAFLGRRIGEIEAEIRQIDSRLSGRERRGHEWATFEVSEACRERMIGPLAEANEKLAFYKGKLADTGATVFTRETLKGKKEVRIRGGWHPIVKLNPKTVSVPNICFHTAEDQARWAFKYSYSQVLEAR